MSTKVLTERLALSGRIGGTPDAPVIEGVLLCGPKSANKRRYLKKAFEGDRVKRYNGAPVNLNHGRDENGRPYQEQIGTVQNARHREDGMPIGDIAVNPKKPYAEAFLWDAQHAPGACAMSHVAKCDTKRAADGWDEVLELVEAHSVDVIGGRNAATAKSLFENKGRTVGTLRTVLEGLLPQLPPERAKPARKWLVLHEDDTAMAPMLDTPVDEPVEGTDPDQAISDAFKTAMHAQIDALLEGSHTLAELISKIRELGKAHGKLTGAAATTDTDSDDDGESDAEESKRPSLSDLVKECTERGFPTAGGADLALLEGVPSRESRALIIDRMKGATSVAETPVSAGRDRVKVKESKTAAATEPALTVDEFLARVR